MSREDRYALVQAAAAESWETGTRFRETLRKEGQPGSRSTRRGMDEVFRPERYVARLGPVFARLADLT